MRPSLGRLVGRIAVACVAIALLTMIGIQYARVIGRNIALANELHATQADVAALKVKKAVQLREIRRLSDPRGAMPEIQDKLHLVGDHQAIIYLKHGDDTP